MASDSQVEYHPEAPAESAPYYVVGRSRRSRFYQRPWLVRFYWNVHSYTWDDFRSLPEVRAHVDLIVTRMARHGPSGRQRVLDVGCGTGRHALVLAEAGFGVVGIDLAPGMLRKAQTKAREKTQGSVVFARADFNSGLPFRPESFDGAICVTAFHWVWDPPHFLGEMRRVLRPGGLFFVLVLGARHQRRPGPTVSGFLFLATRVLTGWQRRVRLCTKSDLIALLNRGGFEVIEERGLPGGIAVLTRKQ